MRTARGRFVSLFEMFGFDARDFCIEFGYLHALAHMFERSSDDSKETATQEMKTEMAERLEGIKGKFSDFGISATIAQIDRLVKLLRRDEVLVRDAARMFWEIQSRFLDEMTSKQFFTLYPHKVQQLSVLQTSIDEEVVSNFPTCIADFDEAIECYAVDRHTACVFHLMRVLEIPLQVLARILLPDDPKPNWDPGHGVEVAAQPEID